MPTGRMSDLKRLLPPGTTIWAGTVDVPQTYDRHNSSVQKTMKIWRVSVYSTDRVFHYDHIQFSKAVRLAISAVCTSGWTDRLWSDYAAKHPNAGIVTRESVCSDMTITPLSEETRKDENSSPDVPKTTTEKTILKRNPEGAKVMNDQECYDCGAQIDPIYINCPICGSYSVYEIQREIVTDGK